MDPEDANRPTRLSPGRALLIAGMVGGVCWLLSQAVLMTSGSLDGLVVLIWPSAGLALAAALRWRWPALAGAFVAALVLNRASGPPSWAAVCLAGGSLAESLLASRPFRIQAPGARRFVGTEDHRTLAVTALWTPLVSALIGTFTVVLIHRVPLAGAPRFFLLWWMANLLGQLVVTPAITLLMEAPATVFPRGQRLEWAAYLMATLLIGHLVYVGGGPVWFTNLETDFWPFLLLVWGATRFGHVGVTLHLALAALQMLLGTQSNGGGSTIHAWGLDRAVTLWLYLLAMLGMGHLMAALIRRREQAEAQARAQGSHLAGLIRHLPAGLVIHGPDTRIETFNPMACTLLGMSEAQMWGKEAPDPAWCFFREDGSRMPLEEYPVSRVLTSRKPVINLLLGVLRPGADQPTWLMGNAYPILDRTAELLQVVVVFVDVTEAIQSRRRLAEGRRQLEEVLAFAKVGDWSLDLSTWQFTFSDPFLGLLGTDAQREGGHTMSAQAYAERFLAPGSVDLVQRHMKAMANHPGPTFAQTFENDQLRADGTPFRGKVSYRASRNEAGHWQHVQGLTQDITELHQKEQELRRLALVAQRTTSSVIMTDATHRIAWVNPAFTQLTGYSSEEAMGRDAREILPELGLGPARPEDPSPLPGPFERDMLSHRRDGSPYWVHTNVDPILDDRGEFQGYILVQTDLTPLKEKEQERILLERDLLHMQKVESLGTLASGIAHDMNNVLGAIMGATSAVLHTHPDEGLAKRLGLVLMAAERGRELVKNLNAYARKDQDGFQALEVNPLVEQEAAILRSSTFRQIEVHCTLAPDLPPIWADAAALGNALMNLCTNALDAMAGQGRLTLATALGAEGWVEVAVSDTGSGMPPQVRARALEPFFTTKEVGKGTGLGLAMVMGTLKSHGGTVDIESEVGRGTTVRLRIPPMPLAPTDR
jgi:PAS domain S-box-containing protein